jgi:hypothetical protein
MDLNKILEDDRSVEDFLMETARSKEYLAMRDRAELGPHVPSAILEEYVQDTLSADDTMAVMEHIALCRRCTVELLKLRGVTDIPEQLIIPEEPLQELISPEHALADDESFEAFLMQAARSPEFRSMRARVEAQQPLSPHLMVGYVLGTLDNTTAMTVMERVALDAVAAREMDWLREKARTVPNVFGWLDAITINVKEMFFDMLTPVPAMELAVMGETSGDEAPTPSLLTVDLEGSGEYRPGHPASSRVQSQRKGHIWVFCNSEEDGPLEWVFPNNSGKDVAVRAADGFDVRMAAPESPGVYHLKAVWTADRLIDPMAVDFDNRFEAMAAMEEFLKRLKEVPETDWVSVDREFRVLEPKE